MDYNRYFADSNCFPVSVIATFNQQGEIRPDYIQVIQPDESRETFKVQGIKSHKKLFAYIQFVCIINVNDRIKEVKLFYFVADHVWCMGR